MNDSPQRPSSVASNPVDALVRFSKWSASLLALVSYGLVLLVLVGNLRLPGKPGWPDALLVFTATLATLAALACQLPAQNTMLGAVVIALIGSLAHSLGAATAMPFGPFSYTAEAGPRLLNILAWPMPFVWVVAVLNSRGVARLILRPWRKLRTYGFWLIGVTVALTVLFDAGLEPFAAVVKRYWLWQPTRIPVTWGGAPVTNFLGWLLTALLILAFATPALIDKRARPGSRPPDYHPLGVWLLAMILFATGAALRQLWLPVAYCAVTSLVVIVLAVRGARW
jgi:putative membrane protein